MSVQDQINLAVAHHRAGRFAEAESVYRQILASEPNHAVAHSNLGCVLFLKGEWEPAVAACQRAIELNNADCVLAHNALGCSLIRLGRFDEAIDVFRQAIAINPALAEVHNNLAHALHVRGANDESIAAYRRALELRPEYADAHTNLAGVLMETGENVAAMDEVRKALALQPNLPAAHWNYSQLLLRSGDLQKGWRESVWRWKMPGLALRRPKFTRPEWDGFSLKQSRILLWQEGGFGDAVQMIRFIPELTKRGGKPIVYCDHRLHGLFSRLNEIEQLAAIGSAVAPEHDVQCSLLELPRLLGTTLETIPEKVPYLTPDIQRSWRWKEAVPNDGRIKVGLVWANKADPLDRCPAPADWSVLAELKHVWLCSLQKPISAERADAPRGAPRDLMPPAPPGLELTDWTGDLRDFDETAALIANLDLVLCVDTAVAHLAGALGKRVWLVLRFVPDARWLTKRGDSPWYPTMRLFRQSRKGDWKEPVNAVVEAIKSGLVASTESRLDSSG